MHASATSTVFDTVQTNGISTFQAGVVNNMVQTSKSLVSLLQLV